MINEGWEPLVEITVDLNGHSDSLYCLFSRAFLRSNVVEESWTDLLVEDKLNSPEEETRVEASYFAENPVVASTKKNELEATSCYCSASHYSTDDYESVMQTAHKDMAVCPLQNSDSGADLSEHFVDRQHPSIAEEPAANGKSEMTKEWEKHWSQHGESIIWRSWIEKYGLYINPTYVEPVPAAEEKKVEFKDVPDVKITHSEDGEEEKTGRADSFGSGSGYERLRRGLRSRCSNASASGKSTANTIVTTDSMTNVTKITVSSLDLSGESESDGSGSGSNSNISSSTDPSSAGSDGSQEDMCPENDACWRELWKDHYDDLFAEAFKKFEENYIAQHPVKVASPGGSDEERTLEEAKQQLIQKFCSAPEPEADLQENDAESRNRQLGRFGASSSRSNSFHSWSYINSVGYILQKLNDTTISDSSSKMGNAEEEEAINEGRLHEEPCLDAIEENDSQPVGASTPVECCDCNPGVSSSKPESSGRQGISTGCKRSLPNDGSDDDDGFSPKRQVTIDSCHKNQSKKNSKAVEKLKKALGLVNVHFQEPSDEVCILGGTVHYLKRNIRAQNRKLNLLEGRKRTHTYFDDEGNVSHVESTPLPQLSPVVSAGEGSEGYDAHSSSADDRDHPAEAEPGVRKQKKKKKKQKKATSESLPPEIAENPKLMKYWRRRHQLFSKYDEGIRLDAESWFSVTPEKVAAYQAERCRCDLIVDAFCGSGGNSIQFALTCERVIAIDIDPAKLTLARHNAEVYGVADRIEFVCGDFMELAPNLHADVVFLSPPWGGPQYKDAKVFGMEDILPESGGGAHLYQLARAVAPNVAFFLPRNINTCEVLMLDGAEGVEIEHDYLDYRQIGLTAYFGDLIRSTEDPDPEEDL